MAAPVDITTIPRSKAWENNMQRMNKRTTQAWQLHAALARTDPSGIDPILIGPTGRHAAFGVLSLRHVPELARRTRLASAARERRDLAPAWRKRAGTPENSVLPSA